MIYVSLTKKDLKHHLELIRQSKMPSVTLLKVAHDRDLSLTRAEQDFLKNSEAPTWR